MFKKGFIFGLLGFLVSLLVIHLTSTDKSSSQEFVSFSYADGVDGWVSFGNILEENFRDPFLDKDPIFIEMFMFKVVNPINIPNKPEITITEDNNSIFWTNGPNRKGTIYGEWKGNEKNGNVFVSDSTSIVRIGIVSGNRRIAGYLYLKVKNRANPKDFAINGWKYYGSMLAASNTLRGDVAINNRSGIRDYINRVTIKDKFIHLTILGNDNTLIWDKDDNSAVGKRLQNGGWISQESNKNETDKFYFEASVKQQDTKIANIYFLVDLPSSAKGGFISSLLAKAKILLTPKRLIPSVIAFFVFFLAGVILSKGTGTQTTTVKRTTKATPELENKIQQLKEEINRLEETKADVTETVAKEQKTQKDLEKEIKLLEEKKGNISAAPAGDITEEVAEKQKTKENLEEEIELLKQEKENISKEIEAGKEAAATAGTTAEDESEEELLFNNLLGESSKTSAQRKEEIELTQRIVAKRREEIDLSSKVESRRKELLELQQNIEKLKEE